MASGLRPRVVEYVEAEVAIARGYVLVPLVLEYLHAPEVVAALIDEVAHFVEREVVAEHGSADRVEVISFFTEACVAAVRAGVTARLVIWADYTPHELANWAREHGIEGVSMEGFILSERLYEPLAEAGLTISVGAVNSSEQLELVLPFGPEILVSDCPLELRRGLDARL